MRVIRILKPALFTTISTLLCQSAFAVAPGLYLGLMMGPGNNGGSTQPIQIMPLPTQSSPIANTGPGSPKGQQFGTRLYLGYKFNTIAGFEGGFTYLSGINYNLANSTQVPAGGTTARVKAVDIVGKIEYTFQDMFGVFGKAGVSAMYTTTPGGLNVTNWHQVTVRDKTHPNTGPTSVQTFNSGSNTYGSKLAPTFTLGGQYQLNQNWVADLSWMRLMPGGYIGNVDIYALGFSYHFVDKYEGQFLA